MSTHSSHRAFFLVGPTATGKTAVAQRLAERYRADILSADSMLVYRGMDIGTAKPSLTERKDIRYWGVDVAVPAEPFSVGRFLEEARRCFQAADCEGRPVIVVGGTGLYVKALLEGLDELPAIPPESRAHWREVCETQGAEGLREALKSRGPKWLDAMADPFNCRRLVRALELVDAGCVNPPHSWTSGKPDAVVTGLDVERATLVQRIETRVREMYDGGLLHEVKALLAGGWDPSGTAAQAIGYAEAIACMKGELTRAEAMARTAGRTRQLAKRQMTWFRHQVNVSWIPVVAGVGVDGIADKVSADWDQHGPQTVRV